jgi:hypothetical protein
MVLRAAPLPEISAPDATGAHPSRIGMESAATQLAGAPPTSAATGATAP